MGRNKAVLHINIRADLLELARVSDLNISRFVEDSLSHYLGVNSPTDEIKARIAKTKAELAALETSLKEVEAQRPSRELRYWVEKYRDLGKSKEVGGGPKAVERWIAKVAKILKMDPAELKRELEGQE